MINPATGKLRCAAAIYIAYDGAEPRRYFVFGEVGNDGVCELTMKNGPDDPTDEEVLSDLRQPDVQRGLRWSTLGGHPLRANEVKSLLYTPTGEVIDLPHR